MSDQEVKWFSFPFIAPKGKGSNPEPAHGEIVEIDPPTDTLPCRSAYEDPFRRTPEQRRRRIIELLLIAIERWLSKKR